MKFALALLAVLATAGFSTAYEIPNVGHGKLAKELQDFIDLMPGEEMLMLVLEYLAEDDEFQTAVNYLQSTEFQELAKAVETIPEVRELMNYIHNAGLDIYYLVNKLNEFIGIDKIVGPKAAGGFKNYQISGGIRGFVDDMKALLPLDQIEELYNYKLKNSPVFADFIAQLESPEFQNIVNTVYANEHMQELLKKADAAGIDLVAIKDLLYLILGIHIPPRP